MHTRSSGQEPTNPYLEPERFIHHAKKKNKRNIFIPLEDRVPKVKYPPFENLFEALVVYNPFLDLPFPVADDRPMWGNNRAIVITPGSDIVVVDLGDNFTVKGHHLSMIKDRQFDDRAQDDPHAKVWFNELSPGVITTWEEMRQAFVSRFSPPAMFNRLMGEIRGRGTIIQIFYHGLDKAIQAILDAGGIFLYKTPNEAHQLPKDGVLLKLDWSKDIKAKPLWKTVAFAESIDNSQLMEKMEALTTKIDSQFKDIKGEMKEMRDGCNSYRGPHPSSECDDKPMGGPKEEEANYTYGGYRGGGYRRNYYGRSSRNWRDRQL
ncbi:hypothetical protein Tco_1289567 [Tanacetum coccineum]